MDPQIELLRPGAFPRARDLLEALEPSALDPLVGEAQRAHVLRLVDDLAVPIQTACYEARLAEGDPRVDLALCVFPTIRPTTLGRAAWPGCSPTDDRWQRAGAFLDEWNAPGSRLGAEVPFVWVAFDLPDAAVALPAPCLGVCADPHFFYRRLGGDPVDGDPASRVCSLADRSHRTLLGEPLPEDARRRMGRCLGAGAEAKHLSFMLGRTPATVKLDVRLRAEGVASFLRTIEWPEDADAIQAQITALMPWSGHVQLNLVLHPELAPPLEVEFLTTASESTPEQRGAFVEMLASEGLCGAAKARVLLSAKDLTQRGGGDSGGRVVSGWYVKVRFAGGRPREAKAYLGLMPRLWRRASGAPQAC
jgi:hypothetical protein